jgi:uncharacterized membrane protein
MAYSHVLQGAETSPAHVSVRSIGLNDLTSALRLGLADFYAMPTHAIFLCLIYPIIGLVAARFAFGYSVLPLIYPLATGFALVGPFAALGLYELSRRREAGQDVSVSHSFDVLQSSSIGSIVALGLLLLVVFGVWMAVANAIYVATFGYADPVSLTQFAKDVLSTKEGWMLIVIGNGVGLLFAALVLTIGAVSFPLLVDRDVGAATALMTSIQVVLKNPLTMAVWGLIVAAMLFIGSLPLFLGLTVVVPVLGHATWHLYRRAVDPGISAAPQIRPPSSDKVYAAHFPANLFAWWK